MQQLRPFSLPFKSIFLILHVTPLSCGLLNTIDTLDAIVSYFSAKFWTLLCPLSKDNRVRCGATGRSVPLKCLKRTGCLTAPLLIYPRCLFKRQSRWLHVSYTLMSLSRRVLVVPSKRRAGACAQRIDIYPTIIWVCLGLSSFAVALCCVNSADCAVHRLNFLRLVLEMH